MKKTFFTILSIILFLLLWQILSAVIDSSLILPGPAKVFFNLISLLKTKAFYKNFLFSFLRVISAFSISLFAGIILGTACGFFSSVKSFFSFPLTIIRSTPIVALILILVFIFQSSQVPVIAAVLMAFPIVTTSICTGTENFKKDSKINEMTNIFGFTERQKAKYIFLPLIKPHLKDSAVSSFGIAWKVVAAGEVLSLPRFAMGTAISKAQVHLETADVLSYTLVLIIASYTIESILKIPCTEKKLKSKSNPPDAKTYMPSFQKNDRLAIIAPSGFGKTTLLNYISRNYKNVSYAFQEPRLIQTCTAFENIILPLQNKFDFKTSEKIANYFIENLSLKEKKDTPVKFLSGGQAQRVSLARALSFPSEILLLDEAINSQDYELKIKIMDFIISELDKNPRTLIFVTHDERDGKYLCKKIIHLTEKN